MTSGFALAISYLSEEFSFSKAFSGVRAVFALVLASY